MEDSKFGKRVVGHRFHDALSHLSWQDFEVLLANYYREQGYEVEHCGTGSPGARDGGVDLRLRRDSQLILVQCKHEDVYQVEPDEITQLVGAMSEEGATGAIVVTSGEFTAEARRAGEQGSAQLVDGVQLRELLGDRLDALNATEPVRPVGEIFVKDGLPRSRGWRPPRDPPKVMIAKGLFALALAAIVMFLAPSAISRWFPAPPSPPAAPVEQPADSASDVPLPPADFRPATEPETKPATNRQ